MKIGFIGLGKMGGQMVGRLVAAGHEVVAVDPNSDALTAAVSSGAESAMDRQELVSKLPTPTVVWLMIPAQFVDTEIEALLEVLPSGSIIVDGGNSDFRLTLQRAAKCRDKQITLVDVGTSGGILGAEAGFSMMVGGEKLAVDTLQPALETLALPRGGWYHFGESGSGHYIKMVHNAIEYGLMESYAEGYRLLNEGPFKSLDLAAVGELWQKGGIISSLLNGLTAEVLRENPTLDGIDGFVAESGEARWTLETAAGQGIEMPAIKTAFDVRVASQNGEINFATKLLAAMRNKFGGHHLNQ
jgi:6-phosphogluconate dehydrogenase